LIAISALTYSWSATAQTLSVSPISLPFGTQVVRTTSAALAITVTNTGTATLAVGEVALTGANRNAFTISGNTCTLVAPSGTCSIGVEFTPPALGAKSADVSISSNVAGSPTVVDLTGTRSTASSVTAPSGAIISQTPAGGSRVAAGTAVGVVLSLGSPDTVIYSFVALSTIGRNDHSRPDCRRSTIS